MSPKKRPPATPLSGDGLLALRTKILDIHDVHPKMGASELADLILAGKNKPSMEKNALRMQVKRTIEKKGKDNRKSNGREPWVRTPTFVKSVRQMLGGKHKLGSSRTLAKKKECSQWCMRQTLKKDLKHKAVRRRKVSKLTEKHKEHGSLPILKYKQFCENRIKRKHKSQEKRVASAKKMRRKYGAKGRQWQKFIYTDFSAPMRLNKAPNRQTDVAWVPEDADEISMPSKVDQGSLFRSGFETKIC